jgi:uridylate kinase
MKKKNKRILLKLSGEALLGSKSHGVDYSVLGGLAKQIVEVQKKGYQVAVVIGAGNIWRFRDTQDSGIERVASDNMGMLATIMNSVALMSAIEKLGTPARVSSAIDVPQVAEPYITRRAIRHLEKGRVVICAGGTGNPFFTTDSAAALRALELNCDILLKATNVKGVYSADPKKDPKAKLFKRLTFSEVLEKNLKVMDGSAIALCRDGSMPICVFEFLHNQNNILKVLEGKMSGTTVM